MNGSDAYLAALRLLTGRAHSQAELGDKLRQRDYAPAAIAAALERCRELGYVDDERYARDRAAALLRSGRAMGRKVLEDLRRRGIEDRVAQNALAAAGTEVDSAALVHRLLERRFSGFDYATAAAADKRRVVHFFLRRGFPLALVLSILSPER